MATTNNNLPVRVYSKQFLQLLSAVYQVQSVFMPTFGALQALDGVSNNDAAFSVKTNDMSVVVGEYSTDANTAFGTGTSKSSRFGDMKEVIYTDTDVPYTANWAIREGLDEMTVNNDLDAAVADRLNLQAQAKTRLFNVAMGKALAAAGTDLGAVGDLNSLFESVVEKYTDLEVIAPVRAYVTAAVYNAIIDLANVTTAKNSAVNIDTNGMLSFRGVTITKVPTQYMGGKAVIFAPDNIARLFTGINIARTIQAIDFAGVELQGAGKYGTFILDDNKKAIFTATPKA